MTNVHRATAELTTKRDELLARARQVAETRKCIAYAAIAESDPRAPGSVRGGPPVLGPGTPTQLVAGE